MLYTNDTQIHPHIIMAVSGPYFKGLLTFTDGKARLHATKLSCIPISALYAEIVDYINSLACSVNKLVDFHYHKVKFNVHVLPKSAGVVIPVCPGIAKCFQDRVRLD